MSFVGVYFIVAGRDTPAAVAKATQPPPDEPPVSIASKIFPGWFLSMSQTLLHRYNSD